MYYPNFLSNNYMYPDISLFAPDCFDVPICTTICSDFPVCQPKCCNLPVYQQTCSDFPVCPPKCSNIDTYRAQYNNCDGSNCQVNEFQRIKFNGKYFWPLGFLRIWIILFTLGGIISSCLIIDNPTLFFAVQTLFDTSTFSQTVIALIVLFSIFFAVSFIIFLLSITNFVNLPGISSRFWLILVILHN